MTAEELIASRVAPHWLPAKRFTGDPATDAAAALGQRYRKADGTSLTQFNTGALVVRESTVLALTECQPLSASPDVLMGPAVKSRAAVLDDIRRHGPPLLAVLFSKGAFDIRAWLCCTPDEVVLNGLAGPEEIAAMEDVALLRSLPGQPRAWRMAANLYAQAGRDPSRIAALHAEADRLSAASAMAAEAVLGLLHRLQGVQSLAYSLTEPPGGQA